MRVVFGPRSAARRALTMSSSSSWGSKNSDARSPSRGRVSVMIAPAMWASAWADLAGGVIDHLVDKAVVLRLVRGEPAVAVRVGLDPLNRLAGVERDALGHHPLQVDDLLRLDRYVGSLTLHLARRLVHEDPAVRQCVALARGARAEEELSHRGGEPYAGGPDVATDELHRVVDG